MKYVAGGEYIKKIEPGTVVLFGGFVVLSIVLSRFFCGWFCAFGALQGVFGSLGKKIFRRRFTVPVKLDRVLRWIKYPLLAFIVYLTWVTGTLIIRPYEPLAAYGHLAAGLSAIWAEFSIGFIILIVILVLSMLYERVFCKYLCPLGAVNSILGRIPLFRIKREASTCISCSKCDAVCPMNIDVSHAGTVSSSECIACMECVTACPTKKKTLFTTLGGKTLAVGSVVAIGFAIYLAAALVGQATGMLHFAAPSLQSMARSGILKVEDIKGSSTYENVAASFNIELERLYREVGIDLKHVPANTMLKETGKLANIDGFEADAVRVAVAKILGVPYTGEAGEAATNAVSASATEAVTKPEAEAAPEATAIPATESISPVIETKAKVADKTSSSPASLSVPADFALEGTMTISDIALALNATTQAVIEKLGLPADITQDIPLRDMKDQYGYTMPTLKEKIKQ